MVVRARKRGGGLLLKSGYPKYAKSFTSGRDRSGLRETAVTAHGTRSGGATEGKHRKMSEPRLMEKGRWGSRGAMRVYLDQIGALAAATKIPLAREDQIRRRCADLLWFFPELAEGMLPDDDFPSLHVKLAALRPEDKGQAAPAVRRHVTWAAKLIPGYW